MKTKTLIGILLALIIYGCRTEKDDMTGLDAITDTFVLVDYYSGVYKFVQIDNEYTVGVEEGLVEIPAGFHQFESEEKELYYQVDLKLTGIQKEAGNTNYQRYSTDSDYFRIKQAGKYGQVMCSVHRVAFFNDYLYYLEYE